MNDISEILRSLLDQYSRVSEIDSELVYLKITSCGVKNMVTTLKQVTKTSLMSSCAIVMNFGKR